MRYYRSRHDNEFFSAHAADQTIKYVSYYIDESEPLDTYYPNHDNSYSHLEQTFEEMTEEEFKIAVLTHLLSRGNNHV